MRRSLLLHSGLVSFHGGDHFHDGRLPVPTVFDFPRIARLFSRPDFHFHFDAINGVSGAYAKPLFHDLLGAPLSSLHHCTPKPVDFRPPLFPRISAAVTPTRI